MVLVLLNGYFAAAEIALISARRAALKQRAQQGSKGAATAITLTEDPTRLLATIQIGITLVGFLASASAAVSLSKPLERWLAVTGGGWLAPVSGALAIFLVTLMVSYVSLVLGELVPKRIGLHGAERVAVAVSGPIAFVSRVASPAVWLLTRSTTLVVRAFGLKSDAGRPGVSEEEIKLLVTEQGSLLDEEKRMIHEIFELGDTVAREIMVPRVDMVLVSDGATVSEAAAVMRTTGFSRLPVFRDDRDRIVGVTHLKDLVEPLSQGLGEDSVVDHMREPVFVPETKGILPLLSEMQRMRIQVVVVVDEYGGTAGLVTTEDIVEEVVGEIADEFDRDQRYISTLGEGSWVVDGRLPIEDAQSLGLPVAESDEYETVAGWVLSELGHIPATGERLTREGYEFRVQAMRRRRIARLVVRLVENGSDEGEPAPHE